ncbi:unnamed protein product [Brassica oleracea]
MLKLVFNIFFFLQNKTDTMNGNSRRESETESSSSLASQDPPCRLFSSDSLRRRNHRSGQPLNLPIQVTGFSPDDKYSKERFLLKRFGLMPIQGAPVKY